MPRPKLFPRFLLLWCSILFMALSVRFPLALVETIAFAQQDEDQDIGGSPQLVGPKTKSKKELEEFAKAVEELAKQLDDDKQSVREAAEAKLLKLGSGVIEFLPPISSDASPEWRLRMDRILEQLEQVEQESFNRPSVVTLRGKMTGLEAITQIAEQTGNKINLGGVESLDQWVEANYDKTPFWEAFDDVLDQLGLTVLGGDGESIQISPRAPNAPLRIETAGYSGVFRMEPLVVHKTMPIYDPDASTLEIQLLLAWEPRVTPVFVKFLIDDMELVCDDGQVLQAKRGQEMEFVPSGGSQLQVELQFDLPLHNAQRIVRWIGGLQVTLPGRPSTLQFENLMTEGKKTANVGDMSITLEQARKNRDIYEVLLSIGLKDADGSSESFRGWASTHEAFLLDKEGKRMEHAGWSTTHMDEHSVGLSYLFDIEGGLEGCKFMYKAPASIVHQQFEFALEDVPLP